VGPVGTRAVFTVFFLCSVTRFITHAAVIGQQNNTHELQQE
jgi:hypothetical protein